MKKITNIFKMMSITSLTCFLGSITTVGLKNNDVVSDKKQCKNGINKNQIITKDIDAKLIGADKGTITIEYTTPSECKITDCSWSFLASRNFNFNGGKFVCDGVEYTIVEIGSEAFRGFHTWLFMNCNLTIPSTIKKIDDCAFYGNSSIWSSTNKEIININFEEGVEYIGESAFQRCSCKNSKIVLPNSIRYIGRGAFADINSIKELDLTALDHIINIEADPFDGFNFRGFLYGCSTRIIRFKDQTMIDKYSNSQYWSSAAEYFGLKKDVYAEISSKYIGANEKSTFTFRGPSYKQTKITDISSKFAATGNFNFNGGKFTYDGTEYVISEIAHDAFHPNPDWWYFKECKLTIPSTIKKIGDRAFYGNSRYWGLSNKEIIGLNFEEGIEDIGKEAFYKCDDLQSSQLVLPNSLQHIGNNAFAEISNLEELDLSALDHVISLDADPFSKDGCLHDTKISKIWVKDQDMKNKYRSDKHWSSFANNFVIPDYNSKTISSRYIGANNESTFDFNCLDPKQTKIMGVSNNFVASGDFNFNNGKFTYNNVEYAIGEITSDTFHAGSTHWYFKNCKLTIPSTVKTIGDRAFYGNSRNSFVSKKEIIGLNFEEGIEDIGKEAFKECDDLQSSQLVLPNSLQHIGNQAFAEISPLKELDLSALDHVINLDANPFDRDGCLHDTKISKIWVKDQAMKDKYSKDRFWSSVAKYFQPKDHIYKTINSKYIGGDSNSTFDFNYLDPKLIEITGVSSKFVATGNFNFNGGKFTYDGTEYVISEIGYDAFRRSSNGRYFKECNLTIPASIKKIKNGAFYGDAHHSCFSSKEIIGLNFDEGIEDIGKEAFKECYDLKSSLLVLPNSLQHIGNNAFAEINPLKELDLSVLDHVISLDANPFDENGCLHGTKINTIWVKDQAMKDKYSKDQFWSSAAKYFVLKGQISKTINSKYIGGDSNSTFDLNYFDPKQTKITGVSDEFVGSGNFNFNGGKFTYNGTEYVISEIAHDTFHAGWIDWYFKNCKLTIPSTVKTIGDRAFYGNSRNSFVSKKEIVGLNFEEGIEYIGKEAFYKCDDLESDKLVLPNSLQHIGNNAFAEISPLKELDLSVLDHVISLDANPFDENGCLHGTKIKTIWVKDQAMKNKYSKAQYWSSASEKIKVKS
ncbi:MAG: leucine-rich repeat protein [Malacoplasma sp.]|nr:leucine-rich repeat protein [Mycoplasmataceae bacterium]MDY2887430.1 leucine-rich repeat protein [Malacoplasma sp.]